MAGTKLIMSDKPYLRIVGGNFVQKVKVGTEGARDREWKAPDGSEGVTTEIAYMNWTGIIVGVQVKENDYGEVCIINIAGNEGADDAQITLNVKSRYFPDFASKVHSLDLTQPVTMHPYDMEIDGKKKCGISMWQGEDKDIKIKSFFYDGEKNLHGFPESDPKAKKTKTYWEKFFVGVNEFLIEKLDNLVFPEVVAITETETETETAAQNIKDGDADAFEEFIEEEPTK